MLQNFLNLRIEFHQGSNLSLKLVNSSWKETHVVLNLTLDCMLYSLSVPHTICRPMRMLMPNLDIVEIKTDYSEVVGRLR